MASSFVTWRASQLRPPLTGPMDELFAAVFGAEQDAELALLRAAVLARLPSRCPDDGLDQLGQTFLLPRMPGEPNSGATGPGLVFGGGSSYVSIAAPNNLDPGTGSFAVRFGVYTLPAVGVSILGYGDTGNPDGYIVALDGESVLIYLGPGSPEITASGALPHGRWHDFVLHADADAGKLSVWVDLVLVASADVASWSPTPNNVAVFGADQLPSFRGYLRDVRLHRGAAVPSFAAMAVALAAGGELPGMVERYPLNEGTGTTASSSLGGPASSAFVGSVSWLPSSPSGYRARLQAAWDTWEIAGSPDAIVASLHAYGIPDVEVLREEEGLGYDNDGDWYSRFDVYLGPDFGTVTVARPLILDTICTTTAGFTQPAAGASVTMSLSIADASALIGETIFVGQGGYYLVTASGTSTLTATNLGNSSEAGAVYGDFDNAAPGATVATGQMIVLAGCMVIDESHIGVAFVDDDQRRAVKAQILFWKSANGYAGRIRLVFDDLPLTPGEEENDLGVIPIGIMDSGGVPLGGYDRS